MNHSKPVDSTSAFSRIDRVRAAYDTVASGYAATFGDELLTKPLDRALLSALTELAAGGRLIDIGCGPGQATGFLAAHHPDVAGYDLSPAMINIATQAWPNLRFEVADLLDLPISDGSCGGLVSLYSILHLTPGELSPAFAEFRRVLRDGAWMLLATHVSDAHHRPGEKSHLDNWFGHNIDLDGHFHDPIHLTQLMAEADLHVVARLDRDHATDEYPSRRSYLLARAGHLQ